MFKASIIIIITITSPVMRMLLRRMSMRVWKNILNGFDPVVTDLVAVSLTATDTADEIAFRNLSFSR